MVGQTGREPARRDRPDREPGPRRIQVRGGAERRPRAARGGPGPGPRRSKSASGVPINGVASSAARSAADRSRMDVTSASPWAMAASTVLRSLPLRAASAPREATPSAATSSASCCRSASAASSAGVTMASPRSVSSDRPPDVGGASMPVTSPAAPSAITMTARSQTSGGEPATQSASSGPDHLVAPLGAQVAELRPPSGAARTRTGPG